MRQSSREKQAISNLQRTGLSIVAQPQYTQDSSNVRPLGFDTMTINKPIFSKTDQGQKQQAYNYSQYYQPPQQDEHNNYQFNTEGISSLNQQMQPSIMVRSGQINQPLYQSLELQRKPTDLRPYEHNRNFVGQRNQMYDQLSSLAQKNVIAQKTPEQIVNEFKAYTLPKLRLKRFIKMQALMKGYHVRRFVIPRLKQRLQLYHIIAENFLRNTINDKLIPDIVMEVIAYNKYNQDLSLYSDKHRVFIKYIDDILFRVVKKLAREVVKEQTDYLVTSIMNKRFQDKPQGEKDPLKLLTLVFIGRFIEKEVFVVAKECIREMSFDYFRDLQYTQLLKDTLIPNTVRYVVFEALDEIIIERYLDQVINNLTKELANPLASHMYELIVAEQESYSLDIALQNYMYRMMGDVLLEHILLQLQDEQTYDQVMMPKLINGFKDQDDQSQNQISQQAIQQRSKIPTPAQQEQKTQKSLNQEPQQKSIVPQTIKDPAPEQRQKYTQAVAPQTDKDQQQSKSQDSQPKTDKMIAPQTEQNQQQPQKVALQPDKQQTSQKTPLQQPKTNNSIVPQKDPPTKQASPQQQQLKTNNSVAPQKDLPQKQASPQQKEPQKSTIPMDPSTQQQKKQTQPIVQPENQIDQLQKQSSSLVPSQLQNKPPLQQTQQNQPQTLVPQTQPQQKSQASIVPEQEPSERSVTSIIRQPSQNPTQPISKGAK